MTEENRLQLPALSSLIIDQKKRLDVLVAQHQDAHLRVQIKLAEMQECRRALSNLEAAHRECLEMHKKSMEAKKEPPARRNQAR